MSLTLPQIAAKAMELSRCPVMIWLDRPKSTTGDRDFILSNGKRRVNVSMTGAEFVWSIDEFADRILRPMVSALEHVQ